MQCKYISQAISNKEPVCWVGGLINLNVVINSCKFTMFCLASDLILSLRRLVSWINHLPPECWSTFWKSNFKQQLACRFDIMDHESYVFVFWHMQLYMSWYIRSFFGFTFFNILYVSSTLVLTSSCRRSLYTFYLKSVVIETCNLLQCMCTIGAYTYIHNG